MTRLRIRFKVESAASLRSRGNVSKNNFFHVVNLKNVCKQIYLVIGEIYLRFNCRRYSLLFLLVFPALFYITDDTF